MKPRSALPLAGIRVVSLEHALAAPICSRHLADLGADVIKVERPGEGDFARGYDRFVLGQSSFFVWLSRGKRSLTLNAKAPGAKEILARLTARSDVVIQNLAPGAAGRLGISYAAIADANPRAVLADISGYGESGPLMRKKAYDLLIQAEGGLISITGSPDTPSRAGISAADLATGMYALTGILAALVRRATTGRGAHLQIAMLDALAEWMSNPIYRYLYDGSLVPRNATNHPAIAPYGIHATRDGQVILGIQNEREWKVFCAQVLERPELAEDPRFATNAARSARRVELTRTIEDTLRTRSSEEVVALLDAHGIANGRINDAAALSEHVQFKARRRWRTVGTPQGPVQALLPPFTFSDVEMAMGDIPSLGQHTDDVLGELGFAAAEIETFRRDGVV